MCCFWLPIFTSNLSAMVTGQVPPQTSAPTQKLQCILLCRASGSRLTRRWPSRRRTASRSWGFPALSDAKLSTISAFILVCKLHFPCMRVNILDCGHPLGMLLDVLYTCRHWGKLATRADVVPPRDEFVSHMLVDVLQAVLVAPYFAHLHVRAPWTSVRAHDHAGPAQVKLTASDMSGQRRGMQCRSHPCFVFVRLRMRRRNINSSDFKLTRDLQLCLRARIRRVTSMRPGLRLELSLVPRS